MHGFFTIWDYLRWIAQLLLILLYGASVAAFAIAMGIRPIESDTVVAAVIRLTPIFYHVDRLANAQELLNYAVAPLYLGLSTTLLLIIFYSLFYKRNYSRF